MMRLWSVVDGCYMIFICEKIDDSWVKEKRVEIGDDNIWGVVVII